MPGPSRPSDAGVVGRGFVLDSDRRGKDTRGANEQDYYQILGVLRTATAGDLLLRIKVRPCW